MPNSAIVISDLRGGRNGIDSPVDPNFPDDQVVEATNVDFWNNACGRKRPGSDSLSLTGGTAPASGIKALIRHIPGSAETGMELWLVDGAGVFKRLAAGTAWADVTLDDALQNFPVTGFSFNGKLWLLYDTAKSRAHVYDPSLASPRVRVAGLSAVNAPTLANTGVGAWPAVIRYYRIRWWQMSGSTVIRKSEPSPVTSFTPSGAGLATRITQPTPPGEGETDWTVEVSGDNIFWFASPVLTVVATTTIDDNFALTIFVGEVEPVGFFGLFPSAKFGVTDGNRVVLGGDHEGGLSARMYFSPVLGSANKGDDERTFNLATLKGYLDLNEKDGGGLTGFGLTEGGVIWAFKFRQVIRVTPTGNGNIPYQARIMSRIVGSVNHTVIVNAEDASGNPALYTWSYQGPYRIGVDGLQYLGRDIHDYIYGLNGKSRLAVGGTCHGIYFADLGQVWWWIPTAATQVNETLLVLDVRQATRVDQYGVRGGWSVYTGDLAAALSSAMFSRTPAATMALEMRPYIGSSSSTILGGDSATLNTDAGTKYQSFITTKNVVPAEMMGRAFGVQETVIVGRATPAILQQKLIRDFGYDESPATVNLDAEKSETRVLRRFQNAQQSDIGVLQIKLGDPEAMDQTWGIDSISLPIDDQGDLTR